LVTFVSDFMKEYYRRVWTFSDDLDTLLLPNASDPSHFRPLPEPDTPTVSFMGGIAPGRGIELLIEACRQASNTLDGLRLRIASPNPVQVETCKELRMRGDIEFHTDITYDQAPEFLAGTQLCVIPHLRNHYLDFSLPIKLFDYMAAQRAIVATDNPAQAGVLRETGAGSICRATSDAVATSIIELLRDERKRKRMAQAGRRAVEMHYNWKQVVSRLADEIAGLARRASNRGIEA